MENRGGEDCEGGRMIAIKSDKIRVPHKVYLEPVLIFAANHQAGKSNLRTVSRYCRMSVIEKLVRDGYPLSNVSPRIYRDIHRAVT